MHDDLQKLKKSKVSRVKTNINEKMLQKVKLVFGQYSRYPNVLNQSWVDRTTELGLAQTKHIFINQNDDLKNLLTTNKKWGQHAL